MYTFIIFLALFGLAVMYMYDKILTERIRKSNTFEPYEIGELEREGGVDMREGDLLECTESYGEFTQGYNYIVRVKYGGALIVWNDETKPVLAAGLDPRKFKVVEENVDGTAATPTCGCRDGINMNCYECNEKIRGDY